MEKINYIGAYYLYSKEVRRFLKVYNQTLFIPVVTSLLFMAVFNLALGQRVHSIGDLAFGQFIAPGLIMMSVMQNAFANTSSSLIMGKVLGTIIDYLTPPLSAMEVTFSMVMAGVTRGIMVGVLVFISVLFFVRLEVPHIGYAIFFLFSASLLLSLFGMFGGIISETFDQMAAVNSYIIVPMSFLSGTFYSVESLPGFWHQISQFNPFFYMIDGFRYGMTGHHDGNLTTGIYMMIATNLIMWAIVQTMLYKGYRIKS